jgi:predicted alpha/beta superfamily hydrolase
MRFEHLLALTLTNIMVTTSAVTITAKYPSSNLKPSSVLYIRGSACGLSWTTAGVAMTRGSSHANPTIPMYNMSRNDEWSLTIKCAASVAELDFKILVDDVVWQVGANEVLVISDGSIQVFPWFFTNTGTYVYYRDVRSVTLKNTRDLVTYLPPSYEENPYKKDFRFVLAQDGQNLFNASTSFAGVAWECQTTMDQLIVEGVIREMIIVGIDNTAERINEYTPTVDTSVGGGGDADKYLDFLEARVLPIVVREYRVAAPTPGNMGILGSSLGGLLACYAAWTRPHVYGSAGCMSSSFWWDNFVFSGKIMTATPAPSPQNLAYLDVGTGEPAVQTDGFQVTRTHYEGAGWVVNSTLFSHVAPGAHHSEAYWGARFWIPIAELFGIQRLRNPAPFNVYR